MQLNIVVAIQDNSNYGDDLLFLAGIRLLNLHYKMQEVRYFVQSKRLSDISRDAGMLMKGIPFVESISDDDLAQFIGDYIYIHLGGTIFSSQYSLKSKISYFIRDGLLSNNASLPSVYMSLGVDRKLVRKRFFTERMNACRFMAVRDYSSFVAASELVHRYDAFVIQDSVFSFPFRELIGEREVDQVQFDHVNITRYWPFGEICRDNVYYRFDLKTSVGVGFCSSDSFKNISENRMVSIYDGTLKGMIDITKVMLRAKCIVSERYHGVIAAMALGIPVIGNCIDEKIQNLAIDLDAVALSDDYYLFLPGMAPHAAKIEGQYLNFFKLARL